MQNSKEILKKANIMPRLRLGSKTDKGVQGTGPHRVKFLHDKEVMGTDPVTGKETPMIAYLVEENGEKKSYRIPKFSKSGDLHYLVIRLAEVEEGEEVIMEMKKRGIKNYVDVIPTKNSSSVEVHDEDDDEIPIIESDADLTEDNPLL